MTTPIWDLGDNGWQTVLEVLIFLAIGDDALKSRYTSPASLTTPLKQTQLKCCKSRVIPIAWSVTGYSFVPVVWLGCLTHSSIRVASTLAAGQASSKGKAARAGEGMLKLY